MKAKYLLFAALNLFLVNVGKSQTKIKTGAWRGVLKNETAVEIPFNFEVKDTAGRQQVTIINGSERYKVPGVKTKGDSVFIHMPLYDSEFKLKLSGNNLSGKWIKHSGASDSQMDFNAK